jgi:hypothetical protein
MNAGSADEILFDHADAHAQLRGTNRGDIPSGAAAKKQEIVVRAALLLRHAVFVAPVRFFVRAANAAAKCSATAPNVPTQYSNPSQFGRWFSQRIGGHFPRLHAEKRLPERHKCGMIWAVADGANRQDWRDKMTVTEMRTVTPLATWLRMKQKALKEGLRAYRLNGDPRFWAVTSQSRPDIAYEVTMLDGDLLCSCRASEFLPYCKHRALVLEELGALQLYDRPQALAA